MAAKFSAPKTPSLTAPKTPQSIRHASYPTDTPRLTATKDSSTRDYGKKDPAATETGFGSLGLPPGGWGGK